MVFKGSAVALITPFNKNNNINYKKLEELIEFHVANLTDAIVVCGTTGEPSTLSNIEKKNLIKFTIDKVNKRLPVIVGTGSNCTSKAIKLAKYAQSVGADALLVVTPYYNKCNQEGLYMHFKEIADNVSIPIILYNVPSRTGVNIETNTLLKLAQIDNIVGIKEASGDISKVTQLASKLPNDFDIYSGNDDQTLAILALGGKGVISVAANILPYQMHELCNSFFNMNINSARNIQYRYLDLMKNLFIDVNPIPIKEAMNILEYNVGNTRLPLCNMSDEKLQVLKKALSKANIR